MPSLASLDLLGQSVSRKKESVVKSAGRSTPTLPYPSHLTYFLLYIPYRTLLQTTYLVIPHFWPGYILPPEHTVIPPAWASSPDPDSFTVWSASIDSASMSPKALLPCPLAEGISQVNHRGHSFAAKHTVSHLEPDREVLLATQGFSLAMSACRSKTPPRRRPKAWRGLTLLAPCFIR